ncbi:DUF1573 domain-containing protein [Sporomusa termitida]|uniref:DUF1573 domain-containing protein n=1 Tax=Sporomusa termitida TaxID=2377 RepID=A0A517DN38_9FIRM|nr:DUF1573 domain-containing protein [Sporomusa termitida]QDR78774.1 hypothetical protein SPTER_00170 [Sporomusa termitida]
MHDNKCFLDFQSIADDYLIRHRSILDVLTKYQETSARVNRAVAKAVTGCGCIQVSAVRQSAPADAAYSELKDHMSSHLVGETCPQCREVIANELGHSLFYLAALCNLTGLSLHEVMLQEYKNVKTLGVFHLT